MDKRLKDLLRTLVPELRHILLGRYDAAGHLLRGDLDRELERLGAAPDGALLPFDAVLNPTRAERRAYEAARAQLEALPAAGRAAARQEIVERAGYSWINRLIALRAMEARGLSDDTLRANPTYNGLSEALYILRQTQPERAAGADGGWWAVLEDACRAQAAALPGLFDPDDPNTALRPSTPALLNCITLIGGGLPGYTVEESDAAFRDPDAIGWAYQFYQEEAKARTYAKLNAGGKVETRAEIAAVTQLFTEPYMVQWLLQNSLGRTYHEIYPHSRLPETWAYYIRPTEESGTAAAERPFTNLDDLTLMDPCMGGGHFLREAFDLLAAMYREQHPELDARQVADRILGHHLHGIDIDPRAAQLAALTLYLRAWELVRDERRAQRLPGAGTYTPAALNLATTPTGLTPGALERHLARHPEDRVFEPLLRGVFSALEQAPLLGSLLRPAEHLDEAIRAFQRQSKGQYGLMAEDQVLNQLLEELGRHDLTELKRVLLERVAQSFTADATRSSDVAAMLFGREATEGLRFLKLLSRRYLLVATNPPYMGGGNATPTLRNYLERNLAEGKRDLYAAFIVRSLESVTSQGFVGMVTPQSWLYTPAFEPLRARMLIEAAITSICALGRYAFSDTDPPGLVMLSILRRVVPDPTADAVCIRIAGPSPAEEQAEMISQASRGYVKGVTYHTKPALFAKLKGHLILFWLRESLLHRIVDGPTISNLAAPKQGLKTANRDRYLRLFWEVPPHRHRWRLLAKAGGFQRWSGLLSWMVDWYADAAILRSDTRARFQNSDYYFLPGVTYSAACRGKLSARLLPPGVIFESASPGIFPPYSVQLGMLAILNSHVASYVIRALGTTIVLSEGTAGQIPFANLADCEPLVSQALALQASLVSQNPTEQSFHPHALQSLSCASRDFSAARLAAIEGMLEEMVFSAYCLSEDDRTAVLLETGTPGGLFPFIVGYDAPLSTNDPGLFVSTPGFLEDEGRASLLNLNKSEIGHLKNHLRALYEAGPGMPELEPDDESENEEEDQLIVAARIPIPSGTFLEELSQKLQIHPISIYWLLQELRAEGVRCKPEEQRLLEDRLSVLVLRLLGHRWPRQIEASEPVPAWADPDGIIPLTPGTGDPTLAERVRARLQAEEGALGLQRIEALLRELTGQDLETWLKKTFFPRHVRQFKHRPVAWHLASTSGAVPTGAGGRRRQANRAPAFECLLYYHACAGDMLARLRTRYVETLLQAERRQADQARRQGDETAAALAAVRLDELEDFAARLRRVEEEGFACAELEARVESEPLDRWSGDGVFAPASRAELLAGERAWHVDINDGVRVNVAPLQAAGLLAAGVLNVKDVPKAIADRARWRADERRWVREGVLPRCGWMDEDVPESPAWTARAPEREAERLRLEEKRAAAVARLQATSPSPSEGEGLG